MTVTGESDTELAVGQMPITSCIGMEKSPTRDFPSAEISPVTKIGSKVNIKHLYKLHPKDVRKATVIAIIYKGKKVISVGFNRKVMSYHKNEFGSYTEVWTKHAEEDALKKAGSRAKGADLLVIRIMKDRSFGNAKPCYDCQIKLLRAGIPVQNWDWTK
jgi:pyrimidine deaminase RibD-like protein